MSEIFPKIIKFLRRFHFPAAVFVLVVFLFVLHQNNFNIPFNRDEGEYAYSAWLLRDGVMPYENSFLQKPPMVVYTYFLAQIFSSDFWAPRLLSYLFVFISSILIFFVVSKDFGKKSGLISMLFVPLLAILPRFDQFAANTEMFLILPVTGVLALAVAKRENSSVFNWFWAGTLSSAAFFYKYNVILILTFIFLVWIFDFWTKNRNIKEILKRAGFYFFGFVLTSFSILLPFLIKDGGKYLWECTLKFNTYYSGSNIFGLSGFWSYLGIFFSDWWVVFSLLALFFILRPKRWWFYGGLLAVSLVTSFGSWYGHYYIIFAVFLSIISGFSISYAANFISQKFSFTVYDGITKRKSKLNPAKTQIFLFLAIIFLVSLSSIQLIFSKKEDFSRIKLGGENVFLDALKASELISKLTDSQDYVLVAGSEPEILYYSKRKSSTRFVIFYPLMIKTPLAFGYQNDLIAETEKKKPSVIAYVNSYYSWTPDKDSPRILMEYLDDLIDEKYELVSKEGEFGKILVYKRK
jgi:4-amino-4-deoxy-L-arabinose transferase-like glycosyltransferase